MTILFWMVATVAIMAAASVIAGRVGALSGRQPDNLGLREGRLKPPSKTPNSVSSQAALWPEHPQRERAAIAPLALRGDGPATISRLTTVIESMEGARVVERKPDYLYAQFTTQLMRFVDDVEFWFDPTAGVIQVRSASRIGHGDRGVNRARIEEIRARLAAG